MTKAKKESKSKESKEFDDCADCECDHHSESSDCCGNEECACDNHSESDCGPNCERYEITESTLQRAANEVYLKLFMEACEKEWKKTFSKQIQKQARDAVNAERAAMKK